MLKIWGRTSSSNVKKVLWCAEELELPYERTDAGGEFGVVNTPEYRALNPNGLVPTIEDDGLILWESNAIVRYLWAQYGAAQTPADRARGDRWMDWTLGNFVPQFGALFFNLVRRPPDQCDHAAVAAALARAVQILPIVDDALRSQMFLSGRQLGLGDFALGATIHAWFNMPIERPDLLYLRAWYDRLLTRPAYRKHVALPLV